MAGKLADAYVEINAKLDGLNGGLSSAEGSLSGFISSATSILAGLGAGISAGAIGKFFADSVMAASDLNEALNKVEVTFGGSAGAVTSFADDVAAKFGLVKTTVLDAAANIGLILEGGGFNSSAAASMSTAFVKLAADATSFFNVPFDVSLEKIRSGLVGESEPLRQFGVLLSEDRVKAEAYSTGIAKVGTELNDQQKIAARAAIIQADLAKASGDLERTQDSLSNQLRKLSGDWENFKAETGEGMVPVMSELIGLGYDLSDAFAAAFSTSPTGAFQAALEKARDGVMGLRIALEALSTGKSIEQVSEEFLFKKLGEGITGFASDVASGGVNEKAKPAGGTAKSALKASKNKNLGDVGFEGGGFGAFGMFGDLGQQINQGAMLDAFDAKIRKEQPAWTGGHVTDPMSFLKSAQESLLKPQDETAKKSLEELKLIRAAVSKPTPMNSGGVILKGRTT